MKNHLLLKFLLPVLALAVGIVGFMYLVKTKPPSEPVQAEEKAWMVSVQEARPRELAPALTLYGRVESPYHATLGSALNAEVLAVPAREGRHVSKGGVLARLDDRDINLLVRQRTADLAEAKAALRSEQNLHANNLASLPREKNLLALAEKAVERAQSLEKRQLGSRSALDEARQAVERQALVVNARQLEIKNHAVRLAQLEARQSRAAALLEQAELDRERAQITAPFAGLIAAVRIAPGDRVRVGDPLISLYSLDTLEVRAQIPSTYRDTVSRVLEGGGQLPAKASSAGQSLELHLDRLAGEVQADSGGMDGLFRVETGASLLRLGQFLEVNLLLPPQSEVVPLPFEAIYGGGRIYKMLEGRMSMIKVERVGEYLTPQGESQVLVRAEELKAGDQIIVTQLPNAMDGLKVTTGETTKGEAE